MHVSQLNIYPIKSCGGITLDAAQIGKRGFVNDRNWMVIDAHNAPVTQREIARMALIRTAVDDRVLRLSAPEIDALELAVDQSGERVAVSVWGDKGIGAVDQGDAAAEWLRAVLGSDCRFVRFADDSVRQVSQKYAPRETDQLSFADGYPFLIISEESLADLNNRLEQPLPMNRFRPNIVVRGADQAFAEDTWKEIRIGDVIFDVVKGCGRCSITTTNQETAVRLKEPLRTLASYRRDTGGGPLFGQNAIQRTSGGTVHVGAEIEVLS